jgi:hypothetical protein
MKKYVIALFKKDKLDSIPFVGIFENDLSCKPIYSFKMDPDKPSLEPEINISINLRELLEDSKHGFSVKMSETLGLVISEDHVKFYFIKPEQLFSFKHMLKIAKF